MTNRWPLAAVALLSVLLAILLAVSQWAAVAAVLLVGAGFLSFRLDLPTHAQLVLAAGVLAPTLLVGGVVPLRPEDVFIVVMILILKGRLLEWGSRYVAAVAGLLGLYAGLLLAATLYGVLRLDAPLLMSDLFSVLAIVRLAVFFLVGARLGRMASEDPDVGRRLLLAFLVAVGLSSVMGFAQYFNLFGAVHWIVPLYRHGAAQSEIQALLSGGLSRRVPGTVGNPNLFAYILVLGLAYSLAAGTVCPDRRRRRGYLLAALPLLLGIVFTLSRTGFLGTVVVVATVAAALIFSGRAAWRGVGRLTLAVAVSAGVFLALPESVTGNFMQRVIDQFATGVGQATSLARRREVLWSLAIQQIEASPVIGLGPAKAVLQRTIDNSYLTILRSTGILGLLVWGGILFVPALACLRSLRSLRWPRLAYAVTGLAVVPAMMTFGLTSDILRNPQLMGMTWLLLGFVLEATGFRQGGTNIPSPGDDRA